MQAERLQSWSIWCTDSGVDSSSRLPFTAQTNRQTDTETITDGTDRPTHASATTGVCN